MQNGRTTTSSVPINNNHSPRKSSCHQSFITDHPLMYPSEAPAHTDTKPLPPQKKRPMRPSTLQIPASQDFRLEKQRHVQGERWAVVFGDHTKSSTILNQPLFLGPKALTTICHQCVVHFKAIFGQRQLPRSKRSPIWCLGDAIQGHLRTRGQSTMSNTSFHCCFTSHFC